MRSEPSDTQDHVASVVQAFVENFGLPHAKLQNFQSIPSTVLTQDNSPPKSLSPTFSMSSLSSISTPTSLCSRSPTAGAESSDDMYDDDDMYVEDKIDEPTTGSSFELPLNIASDQPLNLKKKKLTRHETMVVQ